MSKAYTPQTYWSSFRLSPTAESACKSCEPLNHLCYEPSTEDDKRGTEFQRTDRQILSCFQESARQESEKLLQYPTLENLSGIRQQRDLRSQGGINETIVKVTDVKFKVTRNDRHTVLQPKHTSYIYILNQFLHATYTRSEAGNATTGLIVSHCQIPVTVTLTRPDNNKAEHYELRQRTVMKGSCDHIGCSI